MAKTRIKNKKITVLVPEQLLASALRASDLGIAGTVKRGLELIAASNSYIGLRSLRGKVKTSIDLEVLREDKV